MTPCVSKSLICIPLTVGEWTCGWVIKRAKWWKIERECACAQVREWKIVVCVSKWERESVCVYNVCVCLQWERERRNRGCVCVQWEREESVCVCEERESRERASVRSLNRGREDQDKPRLREREGWGSLRFEDEAD